MMVPFAMCVVVSVGRVCCQQQSRGLEETQKIPLQTVHRALKFILESQLTSCMNLFEYINNV